MNKLGLPTYIISGSQSIGWLIKLDNGEQIELPEGMTWQKAVETAKGKNIETKSIKQVF